MSLADVQGWASFAAVLISLGGVVYSWLTSGSKANSKRLEEIDSRLNQHAERMNNLEQEVKHLPDQNSVHELQVSLVSMSGDIKVMAQTTRSTSESVKRLEEWALKQGEATRKP